MPTCKGMDHATALKACRALHKKQGKSYYFAAMFFPKPMREATYALYAFFRVADEVVDAPGIDPGQALVRLDGFRKAWHEAYATKQAEDPVLYAAQEVFHQYDIPLAYADVFLEAMAQDLSKARYATYAELERYMYGSAAVVGLMMTRVIGTDGSAWEDVAEPAKKLGEAMQLTNFLRDVKEDMEDRGRVYLPQDELAAAGLADGDLARHVHDRRWEQFMRTQVARADRLYAEAEPGIRRLHPSGRFAVRLASRLYQQILRKIEGQAYDIFTSRAKTSTAEKIAIAWKSL